jgi:hypothetical protein
MLRNFNENSPITFCFDSAKSPLIKVAKDGTISAYKSKNEKLYAIKERTPDDKFVIVWAGQWSSDTFEITQEDIDVILQNY